MASQSRLLCLTSLLAILINVPSFIVSSPLPSINGTSQYSSPSVKTRGLPAPDVDGWIPFDSVGMMLPTKLTDEAEDTPATCNTVECKQRMSYMGSSGYSPLPPGLGLSRRDLPRQGSRDLLRRKAEVGLDDTGEPVYRLADYDDDEAEADDSSDEDEEKYYYDDSDDNEGEDYEEDDDEYDENSRAKRHLPLVRGVSVLGTPTFSRRDESFLARLFRRKKTKTSNKSRKQDKPRRKKSNSKSKSEQLDKMRKKGKLGLGGVDLMKGATIL